MSRHHRRSDTSTTRSRIVLGGAMTAVFLSGGAGVAMAQEGHGHGDRNGDSNVKSSARGGDSSTKNNGGLLGLGSVLSGNAGQIASDNSVLNGVLDGNEINVLSPGHKKNEDWKNKHHEDKGQHKHGKHHWVDRDHDGCDDEDGHRWQDRDHDGRDDCDEDDAQDCDTSDQKKDDDKKDDDKKDEAKKDDTKAEDTKADEDKPEVEAAKADDSSTPEVKDVASVDNSAAGATPVGAADTGDGSFVGAVQPAASSWSMADTMFAAGGGLAAAGLLAGAGVGVGRHRRSANRTSA